MKNFIISHLKLIIIISSIVITTIVSCIIVFNVNSNNSMQSNERDKDKIQIEIVADAVKIRESKEPNSQVIGNVYKNEIYTVISEDKESQYKWLEIETSNGIKGYIVGIEAYVKKLETTIINEEEQKPIIDNNANNDTSNNNSSNTDKPANNTKPNNSNNNNSNNDTPIISTKKTYKVYFNTNGGNSITPKIVNEWENVGSLPIPTRDGYIFQYWEFENGRYNDQMYMFLQNDITLNAVWKKYISQEEKARARETLYNIVEKYGYYKSQNGGYKFYDTASIHFTLGESMSIYYGSSPNMRYCFYNWNKTPNSFYIQPDKVSHDKMEILFPYEEQLFSDVDKIYNEYISTGYTIEHLEPIN